ncbi:MAG TPA: AAA family ATPase, partial [Dongiaceae bacterium]|nr:AAA family ATPase [Dongiaceae bacterium]
YKIKKPVNFGFLDFSTLEKRLHCCQEEVRLNRRTCPDIYLDVVLVVARQGRLYLQGEGEIVDYAVKMRQFDADATLADRLVQKGGVTAESLQSLGYRLAEFHANAARAAAGDPWGSEGEVLAPVWQNFDQIMPLVADIAAREQLEHIEAWSRAQAKALRSQFEQRRQQGWVRELHGDLHAGNIAWIDGQWQPFDCIEFNPGLRWVDTASDLGFLLMDLECKGFRAEANRILNAYLEFNTDNSKNHYDLLKVLDFYCVYRALVRAKVAILRLQQPDIPAATSDTLQQEFADNLQYCQTLTKARPIFLALTSGVSGSGKSTVARRVAVETGAIQLRSDVTRKRLCGLKPLQSSNGVPGGIYTDAISRQTFTQLRDDANAVLAAGFPVIVDATFLRVAHRAPFLTLAWQRRVPAAILLCQAQRTELERRLQARQQSGQDPSEADASVMTQQLQQQESLTVQEAALAIDADRISQGEDFLTLLPRNPDVENGA